jgi:ferrochelatase
VSAWADDIFATLHDKKDLSDLLLLLSAHSLPQIVIDRGDPYAGEFEAAAKLVAHEITRRLKEEGRAQPEIGICYQSEGAGGGQWLGPNLVECMKKGANAGKKSVCVAPLGFLAEHVETLYDLDIEAQSEAEKLDIEWFRVPTLTINSRFLDALASEINKYIKDQA